MECQLRYLKYKKMMQLKCCIQYARKFINSAMATRLKSQISLQSHRKVMPKSVQSTIKLHSFHMLAKKCSKSFSQASAVLEQRTFICAAGFRKGKEIRDQIANIPWIIEKARKFQKNIYSCFTDYAKAFDCVDHSKLENS